VSLETLSEQSLEKRQNNMLVLKFTASALAAAALAGGVGIVAAPTAAAKPRQCGALISQVRRSYNAATVNEAVYGADAAQTISAWQQYGAAADAAATSGCY
jgi:hypothetical protein